MIGVVLPVGAIVAVGSLRFGELGIGGGRRVLVTVSFCVETAGFPHEWVALYMYSFVLKVSMTTTFSLVIERCQILCEFAFLHLRVTFNTENVCGFLFMDRVFSEEAELSFSSTYPGRSCLRTSST